MGRYLKGRGGIQIQIQIFIYHSMSIQRWAFKIEAVGHYTIVSNIIIIYEYSIHGQCKKIYRFLNIVSVPSFYAHRRGHSKDQHCKVQVTVLC